MIIPPLLDVHYLFATNLGLIYPLARKVILWFLLACAVVSSYYYYRGKHIIEGLVKRKQRMLAQYFGLLALTIALLVFFREETSFFLSAPIIWVIVAAGFVYYAAWIKKEFARIKDRRVEIENQKEKEKYLHP